jgi:hypothetical protein
LSLRLLAITAALVAGFAITAAGASATPIGTSGVWTVRPGYTLQLTGMAIIAASPPLSQNFDLDTAYFCVDGTCDVAHPLLSNVTSTNGSAFQAGPFSYANPAGSKVTHFVTLDLHDDSVSPPCDSFSNGPNALARKQGRSGAIDINDGRLGCGTTPVTGESTFSAEVSITRTP